MVSIGRRQG